MTLSRVSPLFPALPLVLATPLVAQNACPTAADRAAGIRVAFEDGSAEVFRSGPVLAVTIVDGTDPDGSSYRMELAQGTHLLIYENVIDGRPDRSSRVTYDYGMPPAEMPVPAPGGRWQSAVTVTSSEGTDSEAQTHAYDLLDTIDIAGCVYDVISVLIAYDTPDAYIENLHYLPELDISYLVWSETEDKPREPVQAVWIGRMK
jgi:hypothetical protein